MPTYRRNRVPGATYFFTVNLADRRDQLLTENIGALRAAVRLTKQIHPFHIDAFVVLPEHLHCLWTLPENDMNFSLRWSRIKSEFSRQLPAPEHRSKSRFNRRERGVWQRRFWEHTIRDEADYAAHLDYIHFNPIKHGLVTNVADWFTLEKVAPCNCFI